MEKTTLKTGRPRRYELAPLDGFANRDLALAAAFLQELAERVYDQISDLPLEAMDYVPAASRISISRLVVHLGWAEANWVQRLTGSQPPQELAQKLALGHLEHFSAAPVSAGGAAELIALCRRVQREYSEPVLRGIADIDLELEREHQLVKVRGVMSQLAWHWSYHSGQIGLIRLLWGSDYQWTSEKRLIAPRP